MFLFWNSSFLFFVYSFVKFDCKKARQKPCDAMPSRVFSNSIVQGFPFWFLMITCLLLISVSCIVGVSVCTVTMRPYIQVHYTEHSGYSHSGFLPILPRHVHRYLERAQTDALHFHKIGSFQPLCLGKANNFPNFM